MLSTIVIDEILITRCNVSSLFQSPTPPQYVFWYHNSRMINYDTARGSVTVQTDPGPTQSRLTIRQAIETDTGNYTCSASNTKPASIYVFVTEGKCAYFSSYSILCYCSYHSNLTQSLSLQPTMRKLDELWAMPQVNHSLPVSRNLRHSSELATPSFDSSNYKSDIDLKLD